MHRSESRSQSGFTLLEVLVVTAVIAILAGISMISMLDALDRAKQRATMADMRTISRALETYSVDNSFMPDDSGGLTGLMDELIPYATNVLPLYDAWGHNYKYDRDVNGNYTLESFGRDGVDGNNLTLSTKLDFERDLVIYNGVFVSAPE